MGRWVGLWRVSGPSLLGTPTSRRLANFPLPECSGRTSSVPFFFFFKKNNFVFGCHDLHSPVRRSEVRTIIREFKPHNSSADRALLRSAGVRIRPPCSRLESRPQTNPPFLHPSLPLPLGSAKTAACCRCFQSPHPTQQDPTRRLWGVRLRAAREPGGGRRVPARPRLEKAGAAGSGGGVGAQAGPPPLSGSPLLPWPGSHLCALKTHFKVCSPSGDSLSCALPTRPRTPSNP